MAKEESRRFSELISSYNETTLKVAFIDAVLSMATENFLMHDGLEPPNMVVTDDGRRVPEELIQSILLEIKDTMYAPLIDELKSLGEIKV